MSTNAVVQEYLVASLAEGDVDAETRVIASLHPKVIEEAILETEDNQYGRAELMDFVTVSEEAEIFLRSVPLSEETLDAVRRLEAKQKALARKSRFLYAGVAALFGVLFTQRLFTTHQLDPTVSVSTIENTTSSSQTAISPDYTLQLDFISDVMMGVFVGGTTYTAANSYFNPELAHRRAKRIVKRADKASSQQS